MIWKDSFILRSFLEFPVFIACILFLTVFLFFVDSHFQGMEKKRVKEVIFDETGNRSVETFRTKRGKKQLSEVRSYWFL